MRRRILAILALTALIWLPTSSNAPGANAAAACTYWPSTRIPPGTIQVYRTSGSASGTVQTVDFKKYVRVVLAAEWPSTYPTAALRSGAVAVKEYAWYYIHHWRGGSIGGHCYDVVDNTNDQIYWPEGKTPAASHNAAVDVTWTETVTRTGGLILTGYRSGAGVPCGADADGYHMFQHSAYYCATAGLTAEQILQMYYGPNLTVMRAPPQPTALFETPGAGSQVISTGSATATWTEELAAGATVTARGLSLQMAVPVNGSCNLDRWLPASPPWSSTGASPQTATGLLDGYCYRFVLALTDSNGATSNSISSTFRADGHTPTAAFTNPATGTVAVNTGTSISVAWTETPYSGTTIVSRTVTQQYAYQPIPGSCAGGQWFNGTTSGAVSPVNFSNLSPPLCYRFVIALTDSAGHTGSWVSGILIELVPPPTPSPTASPTTVPSASASASASSSATAGP